MLPLLKLAATADILTVRDAKDELADQLGLTEEERTELLPSRAQGTFHNRVAWAKTYLKEAGLLEMIKRGHFKISSLGREILTSKPERIDMKYLNQFQGYREFRSNNGSRDETVPDSVVHAESNDEMTPDDAIVSAETEIHRELSADLLSQIQAESHQFFEKLVLDLMLAMGYGGTGADAGVLTNAGADEGIDGIINEDRLGLDLIYLQAKRWKDSVGRPEIQKFVGALHGKRARKGVFLTTSTFTREAREYVSTIEPKVVLIDGKKLAQLMISFDVGVSTAKVVKIKRIDIDYFSAD